MSTYEDHLALIADLSRTDRIAHVVSSAANCCCKACYRDCRVDPLDLRIAKHVTAWLASHPVVHDRDRPLRENQLPMPDYRWRPLPDNVRYLPGYQPSE